MFPMGNMFVLPTELPTGEGVNLLSSSRRIVRMRSGCIR
jgi:hypothetical protein